MGETTGITDASVSGIWCISTDGLPYSAFRDEEEAEEYLRQLNLVKPRDGWDLEKIPIEPGILWGRQPGEEKAVWASLGCFDCSTKKVIQWRRKWVFNGQLVEVPKPVSGDIVPRFIWMSLDTTEEPKYNARCKHLKKLTFQLIPGEPETAKCL